MSGYLFIHVGGSGLSVNGAFVCLFLDADTDGSPPFFQGKAMTELSQYHPVPPLNCPSGISIESYGYTVESGHCSRLLSGECQKPCSLNDDGRTYPVDIDHIEPKSKGGSSSGWNLQLLCSNTNRWQKRNAPDSLAARPSFFDSRVNVDRLRPGQKQSYELILTEGAGYRSLFEDIPDWLLRVVLLDVAVVGAGKTIKMIASLCGINHVINAKGPSRPRIRKVLWMVHQRNLLGSFKAEVEGLKEGSQVIESDLVEHGILPHAPKVSIIESAEDWYLSGAREADIVACCPQSIWDSNGNSMTAEQRQRLLRQFDVIVVDECQFGVEGYILAMQDAPHALKFAMTATPFDGSMTFLSRQKDGRYADLFRLFDCYGYLKARRHGVVKKLEEWGKGLNSCYMPVTAKIEQSIMGESLVSGESKADANSIRPRAIAKMALQLSENKDYVGHVMIRVDSVRLCKYVHQCLDQEFSRELWKISSVYSGTSGPSLGSPKHPWMMSKIHKDKNKRGSLTKIGKDGKSSTSRIVVVVDMGQFGINQPYCNTIAYVSPSASLVEIAQRIGRAMRRGTNIPEDDYVRIVWDGENDGFSDRLQSAINYFTDMELLSRDAFISLTSESKSGKLKKTEGILVQLPRIDRDLLIEHLGSNMPDYMDYSGDDQPPIPDELVASAIAQVIPSQIDNDAAHTAVKDLFSAVLHPNPLTRDRSFDLPDSISPVTMVIHEEPTKTFTAQELTDFAARHYDDPDPIAEAIQSKNPVVIQMVAESLFKERKTYHQPFRESQDPLDILGTRKESQGDTYAARIRRDFRCMMTRLGIEPSVELNKLIAEHVNKALYVAAARTFGLPDFKEKTFSHVAAQVSHAMCLPSIECRILNLARGILFRKFNGQFQGINKLYSDQLDQIENFVYGVKDEEAQINLFPKTAA